MAHLTTLPAEILHNIFKRLRPEDLATLPRLCRTFHGFVSGNLMLCKEIYLRLLDKPEDDSLDWETMLHDVIKFQRICRRLEVEDKETELSFVSHVINQLLKHASSAGYPYKYSETHYASRNAEIIEQLFQTPSNRTAFLQKSSLFERIRTEQKGPRNRPLSNSARKQELQQQSAKLHCLYGRPILALHHSSPLLGVETYPYACSKVYDVRQHTALTKWGPFMNDTTDRVDWEKVEAILIVLGNNIYSKGVVSRLFSDIWDSPFSGAWPKSFISHPIPDSSSLAARDPYDVTGSWYRVVCFLDYNDFFNYNFPMGDLIPDDAPRPALNARGATRLIVMKLEVTSIEDPEPEDGQDLPVVHFKGVSRPLDDTMYESASSDLRGTVRLTKEGEVRWTTYSIFHGHERWKSESVQIGGLRSARGVAGHWFDKDYDAHGPCGPTAFWKASPTDDPQRSIHNVLATDFMLWGTLIDMADIDPDEEYDSQEEESGDDDDDDDEEEEEGEGEEEDGNANEH